MDQLETRFKEFGFPLVESRNVIPDDNSTLFICSGMQRFRDKFRNPDCSKNGSIQSCIRTNDLDLVGDGIHLTSFQMIGNFSFGNYDYEVSVEMWNKILRDLDIKIDSVHIYPGQDEHEKLWKSLGHNVVDDSECKWTDGEIGGYCCEVYSRGLEIGNLVNTLGHSTDVGFGLERLIQVIDRRDKVHETLLFRHDVDPITSDHIRTLELLHENGIEPGAKGRNFICRRLLRRILPCNIKGLSFESWIGGETKLQQEKISKARNKWRKFSDKSPEWWYETFGILPEEIKMLK